MLKLGLIVNPYAGLGGSVGLKGSDGADTVERALALGAQSRAPERAARALATLAEHRQKVRLITCPGQMGEYIARDSGFEPELIALPCVDGVCGERTTGADTEAAAAALAAWGIDLLLFAGGDGTARNIFNAIGDNIAALGIPAGVKMHSGVYATSPEAAGQLLASLIDGGLVNVRCAEVRDIDEEAFRQGVVKAKYYGRLLVPEEGRFLQHVKNAGREVEALVLEDIAAHVIESMEEDALYIIGPGSTTAAIMQQLGVHNTLLGVDALRDQALVGNDLTEGQLLALIDGAEGPVYIVITAIGGQGHILGRGNQQLSPAVLKRVGRNHIIVVATKTKITELQGRPLLVDTNDPALDTALRGYISVITGYHDTIMYPVN